MAGRDWQGIGDYALLKSLRSHLGERGEKLFKTTYSYYTVVDRDRYGALFGTSGARLDKLSIGALIYIFGEALLKNKLVTVPDDFQPSRRVQDRLQSYPFPEHRAALQEEFLAYYIFAESTNGLFPAWWRLDRVERLTESDLDLHHA
jgi:hypothetical protein